MKSSQPLFKIICVALIIVSILGFFEESAFNFLKDVAKRNSEFLATVSEIKMIINGLSSVNVPFVSGHSEGIEKSLAKVQNYLLLTDVITFLQLLFVSICKSIYFKIGLVALLVLSYFDNNRKLFTRLLVIALALSPGLSIYTVAVNHLSSASQIHFGENYLNDLKASAEAITKENSALIQEHSQQITKINNGQKGLILFRKLKEDVSYDIKKSRTDIKGKYVHIRSIIKTAGHDMLNKVFRFCTMILFCLLILPIGYSLIIKVLLDSLFKNTALEAMIAKIGTDQQKIEGEVKKKTFFQKLENIWNFIRKEFRRAENDVIHSNEYKELHKKIAQLEDTVKSDADKQIDKVESKVKSTMHAIAADVSDDVSTVENKAKGDAHTAITDAQDKIDTVKSDVQTDVSTVEDKVKGDVQTVVTDAQDKIDTVKSDVQDDVSTTEDKVKDDVHTVFTDAQDKIDTVKSNVQSNLTDLDDKAKSDVDDLKNKATDDAEQAKDKIDQTTTTVKDDVSETVNEVKDKAGNIVQDVKNTVQKTQPKISL